MATSLKNPPVSNTTDGGAKKYLDIAGLNALWDNICDKFSPQWKTVNFDFIAQNEPVHTSTTVVLPFQNLSLQPNSEGVVDHTNVLQTTYTIKPAQYDETAQEYLAGLMSGEDKQKLDNIEGTAESAVTLKGVMVGGKTMHLPNNATNKNQITDWKDCLVIDDKKHIAWDLQYDNTKDELQIVDLNAAEANKVKTSIKVSDMLGGVLENALIDSVAVVDKDDKNNSGTFIAITFKTDARDIVNADGTIIGGVDTQTVYCNVADLIETYTEGDGIEIAQTLTGVDGNATATTISVVAPTVKNGNNVIGGIIPSIIHTTDVPNVQDVTTEQKNRYFGVETDSAGNAFVHVPSAEVSKGTSDEKTDTINNNDGDDTFKVVTDISISLNADGDTYTYTPEYTEFTISKSDDLTVSLNDVEEADKSADIGEIADATLDADAETKIKYIRKVEIDDHNINVVTDEYALKVPGITVVEDSDVEEITLIPGTPTNIQVVKDVTKGAHHTVKKDAVKISVADPEAIDIDYIEGLQWVIPITKQHYPNETVATEPEE